jgi:anti-sigma28 factor (negative regulator of flagellin synthesis)
MKFSLFSFCRDGRDTDQDPTRSTPTVPAARSDPTTAPEELAMSERVPPTVAEREERLAQLRQQVDEGNYEIPFAHLVRILTAIIRGRR